MDGEEASRSARARHQASRDLFARAMDACEEERAAILQEARRGDPELAAEVEQLLGLAAAEHAALDRAPHELMASAEPTHMVAGGVSAAAVGDAEPPMLPPGTRLGDWIIDECVCQGGRSVVYRGRAAGPPGGADAARTSPLAIRVIRAELVDAALLERFRRGDQALSGLRHPGVSSIHSIGVEMLGRVEQPYLVMDWVEGEDLLAASRSLAARAKAQLLAGLCDAVSAAHDAGLVDGELEPARVRVAGGVPRIIGVGVGRRLMDPPVEPARGLAAGRTWSAYASPRQRQGARSDETSDDVYALGVMAYEVFTGRRPRSDQVGSSLDRPSRVLHGTPEAIDPIVLCALATDVSRRYQRSSEMAADLRRWLNESSSMPTAGTPTRGLPRRRLLLVTVLAVAATLAGAAARWAFQRNDRTEAPATSSR